MPAPVVATVFTDGGMIAVAKAEHGLQFLLDTVGAGLVGFVDGEDVGDFHDAGFDGLHVVTHTGDEDDDGDLREAGDFDFVLAYADGFNDDVVAAGGVHQLNQVGGGAGQTAEAAAGGHGTDEDAGIGMVLLHADAVAQDGSAGAATGGVDGQNGDGFALTAQGGGEGIHQGAFTGTGRAGDCRRCAPYRRRGVSSRSVSSACGSRFSIPVAARGQRARVAFGDFAGEIVHQVLRSCRAITRRWISLVPSPMVQSLTSR